jgi:hypothetical protein
MIRRCGSIYYAILLMDGDICVYLFTGTINVTKSLALFHFIFFPSFSTLFYMPLRFLFRPLIFFLCFI